MKDLQRETAARFLQHTPLLHADMLASLASGSARVLYSSECGVLLFQTSAGAYTMSATDEQAVAELLDMIPDTDLFVGHQKFYIEAVQKKFGLPRVMECVQAVYREQKPLSRSDSPVEIRPLGVEFLPLLMQYYTHADDPDYLRGRLESGAMFGAFLGTDLTGFIGTHEEGSMGILEVLPQFRRRGIALELEAFLVNRLLSEGLVPFAQIETGNEASMALQRKLNFSLSKEKLYWLMK